MSPPRSKVADSHAVSSNFRFQRVTLANSLGRTSWCRKYVLIAFIISLEYIARKHRNMYMTCNGTKNAQTAGKQRTSKAKLLNFCLTVDWFPFFVFRQFLPAIFLLAKHDTVR